MAYWKADSRLDNQDTPHLQITVFTRDELGQHSHTIFSSGPFHLCLPSTPWSLVSGFSNLNFVRVCRLPVRNTCPDLMNLTSPHSVCQCGIYKFSNGSRLRIFLIVSQRRTWRRGPYRERERESGALPWIWGSFRLALCEFASFSVGLRIWLSICNKVLFHTQCVMWTWQNYCITSTWFYCEITAFEFLC